MKKIIDTHAHISVAAYGEDLKEVIKKIKDNNMTVVNVPIGVTSSIEAIALAEEYDFLKPVVGIHPDFINRFKEEHLDQIDNLVNDKVVAIGEIGLDYHRKNDPEDRKLQKHIFVKQIEIAIKHNLPIVIHVLDAHDDLIEIIKDYPEQKFLFHCWSGTKEQLATILKNNKYSWFSFGGEITTKQQKEHRSWEVPDLMKESLKLLPLEKILIETDCPGLIPEPYRSNGEEMNYPWYIKEVIDCVSKELNISFDELNDLNTKNAKEFYSI